MQNPQKTMAGRQEETHWDEDSRRALAHSHMRTLHELESGDKDDQPIVGVTARDPGENILPSVPSIAEHEEASKKKKDVLSSSLTKDDINKPKRASFPTLKIWGQSDLGMDEGTSKLGKIERADGFSRKRQCIVISALLLALASLVTVCSIPATRRSMESAISEMITEGESIIGEGQVQDGQLQVFSPSMLASALGNALFVSNIGGLYSPYYYPTADTLPVLWMVPLSGSDVVLNVLQYCMRLTTASGMGVNDQDSKSLAVLTHSDNIAHYVNVDTTTPAGLERADQLALVESGLADFIATPYLDLAAHLFSSKIKTGRIFAVLEHPVVRAVATFEYLKQLDPSDAQYNSNISAISTLALYADSEFVEENLLTKVLANITTDVTVEHVRAAKMMLEHYVVVGLASHMEESLSYFYSYFGWEADTGDYKSCQANFCHNARAPFTNPNSDEYSTLMDRNWADMLVYDYAKNKLFGRHGKHSRTSSGMS